MNAQLLLGAESCLANFSETKTHMDSFVVKAVVGQQLSSNKGKFAEMGEFSPH
jgi:hypothetical protein